MKTLRPLPFLLLALLVPAAPTLAQEEEETPEVEFTADAGPDRKTFINRTVSFDAANSRIPSEREVQEVLWDFGDGVRTTGEKVTHAYTTPGTHTVQLSIATPEGTATDSTEVRVFAHVKVLIADHSAPEDRIAVYQDQAARAGVLLLALRAKTGGPDTLIEEDLTTQLIDARDAVAQADQIIVWTSGTVGANVLSKFSQHIRQAAELSLPQLTMETKGVILLSETPFAVIAPTAQSVFDQLQPSYVLLTQPATLELLLEPQTAEEARSAIFVSPIEHRLFGTFSARTVRDIGITNFMSFGINFLVNRGVPVSNITLILMLPIIATILAFSRQVLGLKAFGIITPTMTTLSFLVLGLQYGLIVFFAVLAAGTLTRLVLRKLHLLYLPRMALVLTSVSLAILILLGIGVATSDTSVLSFSIFPVLILMLLAEEFISVQFSSGARSALTITAWTLLLAVAGYFIVSWQLFRAIVLSYPEVVLLAIPINIIIGRWSGLRLTEYFRFRKLLSLRQ